MQENFGSMLGIVDAGLGIVPAEAWLGRGTRLGPCPALASSVCHDTLPTPYTYSVCLRIDLHLARLCPRTSVSGGQGL